MSFTPIPTERLPGGRWDAELGPVRVCPGCGDEWPHDTEFFVRAGEKRDGSPKLGRLCKACSIEGFRVRVGEAPRVSV